MLEVQTECVLVVPTAMFHELGHFQGFNADAERYLNQLLIPELVSYRPRREMEEDPAYKQIIPYCIFRFRDEAGQQHLFQYRRGKGQGEGRLHSKRSIGIGGHISLADCDVTGGAAPYREGLNRELAEEVEIRTEFTERCIGLINDDETPVGRVHLGVVHVFDVREPEVYSRETDILEAGFSELASLQQETAQFETWSQICLNALCDRP